MTDGTMGPAATLNGTNVFVPSTLGTRTGNNLFHSFSRFDIGTGRSATFTGPSAIRNVISRVTGGQASNIDGTLASTMPSANVYLINPSGVIFGPNASILVPRSFHATTADYLKFPDGGRFDARTPGNTVLSTADPSAFGFLGTNSPSVVRVNGASLEVATGRTISIVAGEVDLQSAGVTAPGGSVQIAAVTQGEVGTSLQSGTFNGRLTVAAGTLIDATDSPSGSIRIRGGEITVTDSQISSFNLFGGTAAGSIDVQGTNISLQNSDVSTVSFFGRKAGDIRLVAGGALTLADTFVSSDALFSGNAGSFVAEASRLSMNNSLIASSVISSAGNAGNITVNVGDLSLLAGSRIQVDGGIIGSAGRAGSIAVNASGAVTISGIDALGTPSALSATTGVDAPSGGGGSIRVGAATVDLSDRGLITTDSFGGRSGGDIEIVVGALRLQRAGQISSNASGDGAGGNITVAAKNVLIAGNSLIPGDLTRTGIFSDADGLSGGRGNAGSILVSAETVTLLDGGQIGTSSFLAGQAGSIRVIANQLRASDVAATPSAGLFSEAIFASGGGGRIDVDAAEVAIGHGSSISTSSEASGRAGDISIRAQAVTLGGDISARGVNAEAGSIFLTSTDRLQISGGAIRTSSTESEGGDVVITVGRLIQLSNSQITTSVSGGTGSGGNIAIDPDFLVLNRSVIQASAVGGNGGNITIVAGQLFQSPDSVISASSTLGISGTIIVAAPEADISGELVQPAASLFQSPELARSACEAPGSATGSSLAQGARGGSRPDPEQPGAAAFLATAPILSTHTGNARSEDPRSQRGTERARYQIACSF